MQHTIDLQQELGVYLTALALSAEGIASPQNQEVALWVRLPDGIYEACSTSKPTFFVLSAAGSDRTPGVAGIHEREFELGRLFAADGGDAQQDTRHGDQAQENGDIPVLAQPHLLIVS